MLVLSPVKNNISTGGPIAYSWTQRIVKCLCYRGGKWVIIAQGGMLTIWQTA